jgi:hypothetical protein
MKFVLDYGLFFKNPEGVGGTLRLVGWTLDERTMRPRQISRDGSLSDIKARRSESSPAIRLDPM